MHAVVARSTFPSEHVQNTPASDHLWKLRCWKVTPLRHEAHVEVKMYKTHHSRTTFGSSDVEKVHAVVARSTFRSQNEQNTPCSDHFWTFRCRFAWQAQGIVHLVKSDQNVRDCGIFNYNHHYTTLQYITLHYNYNYNYTFTTLYYTTLHYITLHSITLNYTTLRYTTLHDTTLHYTTLHYTPRHYITLHYITLHYITLHYTTLPSTTLHYTTLHSTTLQLHLQLHSTTLNYTTLHSTTLHYTTLHYTTLH